MVRQNSLDGDTLGKKHESYNKLFKVAISSNTILDGKEFRKDDSDVDNLLNIDIASHNKNVDYILSVLKCDDMLYVSRAIKKSTWLITDDQYAHIINPKYLKEHLLPQMTTKAGIKLMKHIRLNLKTESRVEEFYQYESKPKEAEKWLPYCSVPFIVENIGKHASDMDIALFKRLCEKSISILEAGIANINNNKLKVTLFLLKNDSDKFLDIIEKSSDNVQYLRFKAKATQTIMKQVPDRIINEFEKYCSRIHIPTFVKYLKVEDIKSFILKQTENENMKSTGFYNFDTLKYFIWKLPINERFDFVKEVFIDKVHINKKEEVLATDSEWRLMNNLYEKCSSIETYLWYEFAPFDLAFVEIKKLILLKTSSYKIISMLILLIELAKKNPAHLRAVIEYFIKNHKNEPFNRKYNFVVRLINSVDFHNLDDNLWTLLNELFKDLGLYTESENNTEKCINPIIIHYILKNEEIPDIILKKFTFNTLKNYKYTLNEEQKLKVFKFLYEFIIKQFPNENQTDVKDNYKTVEVLQQNLQLLKDWDKQLIDYPFILNKIKNIIVIKNKESSWKTSIASLYNINKTWRKFMFEESIALSPCEEVCLNALKHDPKLLSRQGFYVEEIRCNDSISLRKFLSKLRIYWAGTLSGEWTESYLVRLDGPTTGYKALTQGLCTILSKEPLFHIIKKYAPTEDKINWKEIDDNKLSLQRYLAKNMHFSRPQPSPESILLYARGDYLQFSLPSLFSIFYNLNTPLRKEYIPKLLSSPISLQKHGIRFAFHSQTLELEQTKDILVNIWQTTKNTTIRAVMFKYTFDMLCNTPEEKAEDSCNLLEIFVDNVTFQEDRKIYDLMGQVDKLPNNIRAKFLTKNYNVLRKLLPHISNEQEHIEEIITQLEKFTRDVIDFLCPDFVAEIILQYVDNKSLSDEEIPTTKSYSDIVPVISAYLLNVKDDEKQMQRFNKVWAPLLQYTLSKWDNSNDDNERNSFHKLLARLSMDLNEIVIKNNNNIPVNMFSLIQVELEKLLPSLENYLTLTMWKLIVAFTKTISVDDINESWDVIITNAVPKFAKNCLQFLKEDLVSIFPSIYILFGTALQDAMNYLNLESVKCELFEGLLSDNEFIEAYLTIIYILPHWFNYDDKQRKITENIMNHPSVEIKMHYWTRFKEEVGCR